MLHIHTHLIGQTTKARSTYCFLFLMSLNSDHAVHARHVQKLWQGGRSSVAASETGTRELRGPNCRSGSTRERVNPPASVGSTHDRPSLIALLEAMTSSALVLALTNKQERTLKLNNSQVQLEIHFGLTQVPATWCGWRQLSSSRSNTRFRY